MKGPLIAAVLVVAGRVAAERAGLPDTVTPLISAAALILVIGPIYFALRIGSSDIARPYLTLLKTVFIYALLVRLMVVPTYWLAYYFQWGQNRFAENSVGVVGPGVTTFQALVWTPLSLTIGWAVGALVMGGVLGCVVLAIRRALRKS